jgi:hypothetical protein
MRIERTGVGKGGTGEKMNDSLVVKNKRKVGGQLKKTRFNAYNGEIPRVYVYVTVRVCLYICTAHSFVYVSQLLHARG